MVLSPAFVAFPAFEPEETVQSACARYQDHMDFPGINGVLVSLFGSSARVGPDLPTGLAHLAAAIGIPGLGDRELAWKHTLLPAFTPFLGPVRARVLLESLRAPWERGVRARFGFLRWGIRLPAYVRYCPACCADQIAGGNEPYWLRAHQLSGVIACARHAVWLESSTVVFLGRKRLSVLRSASAALGRDPGPVRTCSSPAALALAASADWLLAEGLVGAPGDVLRDRYRRLFYDRELATYGGVTDGVAIAHWLQQAARRDDLSGLGLGAELRWFSQLVWSNAHPQHPSRHLLAMHLLGVTAQEFFGVPTDGPFGKGPWRCENPAAEHFGEPVITDCKVTAGRPRGKPIGNFRCSCGHSYKLDGPLPEVA